MKLLRLLFVATPETDAGLVADELVRHGYRAETSYVKDAQELEAGLHSSPDFIFTPPDGEFPLLQLTEILTSRGLDIPCIVLLQAGQQMTLAEAVHLGAQDCVSVEDDGRLVPTLEREHVAALLRHNMREQIVTDHLLREIDQYILRSYDLSNITHRMCQRMAELFRLELAWIGMKNPDGSIEVAASSGATAYLEGETLRWDGADAEKDPSGVALREHRLVVSGPDVTDLSDWRVRAAPFAIHSVLAIPLGLQGEVLGVLMMYSREENGFDSLAVTRLAAFASRVTVAMLSAQELLQLRLMQTAMNNASNAMFLSDHMGKIQWLNEALVSFSGYAEQELLGSDPRLFGSGQHEPSFWRQMWELLLAGKPWRGDIVNRRRSGELYTVNQSVTPLFNEQGELTNFLAVQQDISDKRRLEQEIHHLAYHDTLTDLPNRMLFQDRVQQEISHAKRGKSPFSVLFIDLDGFKAVNDTRGHAAGDKLLQLIANRLRTCVREGDTVARLGGDEFTILLRGMPNGEGLIRVLRNILDEVAKPCVLGEYSAEVTASIGVSLYPDDAAGVERLLIHADEAMYQAKQAGKNGYVIYRLEGQD